MKTQDLSRPIIAVTMGDPAGVGPEVIAKALLHNTVQDRCRAVVIGDADRLETACRIVSVDAPVLRVSSLEECRFQPGTIECLDIQVVAPDLPFGQLSAQAGEAAYRFIEKAVELAMSGKVQAICTAPLNKEALQAAGHRYPGHTELLAKLTGTEEVSMMLYSPKLKVIHVTTHIGLLDAIQKIDAPLVYRTIARMHQTLEASGQKNPKIGVCGINPHAGENGLFGRGEEGEKIIPAINRAIGAGMNVEGPLPADTLFFRAARGDFEGVVAMYHDQGHGPVKVLGLELGVNVTIGLPVIRTSVDHGTAFDIAGKGIADERSMIEAIQQAIQLAPLKS